MEATIKAFNDSLKSSKKILITTHLRPNIDTICSIGSLYSIIKRVYNKNVDIVIPTEISLRQISILESLSIKKESILSSLPPKFYTISISKKADGIESVTYNEEDDKFNFVVTPLNGVLDLKNVSINENGSNYDLIITVDTPSLNFLGDLYKKNLSLFNSVTIANIDFHKSNAKYGKYNIYYENLDTTSQVVINLVKELSIKTEILETSVLMAGIMSYTNLGLKYKVRASTIEDSSKLLTEGATLSSVNDVLYSPNIPNDIYLVGDILNSSNPFESDKIKGKIVGCKVSLNKEEVETVDTDKIAQIGFWNVKLKDFDGAYIVFQKSPTESHVYICSYTSKLDALEFLKSFDGKGDKFFSKAILNMDMNSAVDEIEKILEIKQEKLEGMPSMNNSINQFDELEETSTPDFSSPMGSFNNFPNNSPFGGVNNSGSLGVDNNLVSTNDNNENDSQIPLFDPKVGK